MKNLKLGMKIGMGFGILLLIACALGGMAMMNMLSVGAQADRLAQEIAPEVAIANQVERNALNTVLNVRAFGYTSDAKFKDAGLKYLAEVEKYLKDARDLAQKHPGLVKLREASDKTTATVAEWRKYIAASFDLEHAIDENRKVMDQAAQVFMSNSQKYLEEQNTALAAAAAKGPVATQEALERLEKITLINDVMDLGNAVRLANFKGQALRDQKLIQDAMKNFDGISQKLAKLRPLTRNPAPLQALADTGKAGEAYKEAMLAYLKNTQAMEDNGKKRAVATAEVLKAAEDIAVYGVKVTEELTAEASHSLSRASTIMVVGLGLALVLGIVVSIVITKGITGPVTLGVGFAQKM
ncbi:MAG: MCP four helix bundle domain-containing protein, partial [Acidobacteriota bacterium]